MGTTNRHVASTRNDILQMTPNVLTWFPLTCTLMSLTKTESILWTVFETSATALRIASSMPFSEEAMTSMTFTTGICLFFDSGIILRVGNTYPYSGDISTAEFAVRITAPNYSLAIKSRDCKLWYLNSFCIHCIRKINPNAKSMWMTSNDMTQKMYPGIICTGIIFSDSLSDSFSRRWSGNTGLRKYSDHLTWLITA